MGLEVYEPVVGEGVVAELRLRGTRLSGKLVC
jgi:hypothetical protein